MPHDSDLYWPTTIKDTSHWFPFLSVIEHTTNILNPNKGLIPSLLKLFAMIQLRLFDDKQDEEGNVVDIISIMCISCNKETELHFKDTPIEEMITKFVLNAILHHVGMLWIICSNKEMLYEID